MTGLSVALGDGEVKIACATGETNIWLSPSAKQRRNPCSGSPPVYQDLSTRHEWPVKRDMLDLPIRMKGNSKRISGNLLSPLEAQNKYLGAASQTLLTSATQAKVKRAVGILFSGTGLVTPSVLGCTCSRVLW